MGVARALADWSHCWVSQGAKFTKMEDSLPSTPMNRRAKLVLGGEMRNRTNEQTNKQKTQTNSKRYVHTPHLAYRHVRIIIQITRRLYCVEWTQYSIRPKRFVICNTWFPGPTRVGISIVSFLGLTRWQTDWQTDRPRYSVGNNRQTPIQYFSKYLFHEIEWRFVTRM